LTRDVDVMKSRFARLTPREQEICDMIRDGLSSKEISEVLNLSILTVHKHREQIRDKLGLTNQNINLSTFLRSH
jgi:DNA-binding CsgD family transcriptional regulator